MTKLCSVQGNLDADDNDDIANDAADAATTDESNPYMSPFQATQKLRKTTTTFCLTTIDVGNSINIPIYNRIVATIGPSLH